MIIELFILFQIIVIGVFFTAFFTKNEIIWGISLLLSGFLMYSSFSIEYLVYEYNVTTSAYQPLFIHESYPYLMGVNLLFFALGIILGFIDVTEKYSSKKINPETNNKYRGNNG